MTTAPPALLNYQKAWLADKARVRVYEKSRRIGVSWSTAGEAALVAAAQKSSGGMDVWYIGYTQDMAKEFIRDVGMWAGHYNLASHTVKEEVLVDGDQSILTFVVHFASGFRVTALSSSPRNLRGKQGYVIIDEAAFHDDLMELLKASIALNIWGGRIAIISTHNGVDNPFNKLVLDIRAGRTTYSLHRTTFDDAIADGFYKRICLVTKEAWTPDGEAEWREARIAEYGDYADEELFVIPRNSGGTYLSRTVVEAQLYDAPVLRLGLTDEFKQLPDHARIGETDAWCEEHLAPLLDGLPLMPHALGQDFGRVSDLTVLAPVTIEQRLSHRVPFLVELGNMPYRQQEQVLCYTIDRLPRFVGGALDATGNGEYLAEQASLKYGPSVVGVKLSELWYSQHLPPFKAALEDGNLWVPRDADVLSDLMALQVIGGVPKLPKARQRQVSGGSKGQRRHGDSAVALALGLFAARMETETFAYHPVRHGLRGQTGKVDDDDDDVLPRVVRVKEGYRSHRGGAY